MSGWHCPMRMLTLARVVFMDNGSRSQFVVDQRGNRCAKGRQCDLLKKLVWEEKTRRKGLWESRKRFCLQTKRDWNMFIITYNLFQDHHWDGSPLRNGQVRSLVVDHRKEAELPNVLRNVVMTVVKDEVAREGLFKNRTNKLMIHLLVFLDC